MPVNLSGIRKKIERAEQHIDSLNAEGRRFRERCRCKVVEYFDANTRRHTYRISGNPPDIKEWVPLFVGETVHHLRSVLDHLVYQLAVRHAEATGSPIGESTQRGFPVCRNEPTTEKHKRRYSGKVEGLSAAAKTAIESLQPYKVLPASERDDYALCILHELNVIDKHRLPLVVAAAFNTIDYELWNTPGTLAEIDTFDQRNFKRSIALEDGAEIGHAIGSSNMQMKINATFEIAFPNVGTAEFEPITPCLQQLRDFVARIVDTFEATLLR